MTETENQLGRPRTEAGKQRSSLNALKYGLFARSILIDGETQDEYDRHFYRYKKEHNPKTPTEEDLVRHISEIEWRRRRIPLLEADSLEHSLETGDPDRKFINLYSIYDQRFCRMLLTTLKALTGIQAVRKRQSAVNLRIAMILQKYNKAHHIPWNPADDGFVFSTALLDRQIALHQAINKANDMDHAFATDDEMDAFIAQPIM